jgi:hypothetical protein
MPYYKGVHFDQAFHGEEDLLAHNAATPAGKPVAPAPAPSEPEPDFAVSVPDRATPIVETIVAVDAEPDPFPTFVPEKEPETQPEEPAADDIEASIAKTPAESPDAKKKKTGRRG